MKLLITQGEAVAEDIMGLSELDAQQRLALLFGQISSASQIFLLGMAMDLARDDPKPLRMAGPVAAPLHLVVG